jgi:fatty-acyl-CoA synthase/long-chain acyl-CoA synthetase
LFVETLERFRERTAIVADGRSWTYAEVIDAANQLAWALRELGVRASTPVAIAVTNRAEFIIADQALIRLGAAKVALNDMLSVGEIEFVLQDSGAVVAIVDEVLAPKVLASAAADLRTIIGVGDLAPTDRVRAWDEVLASAPAGAGSPDVSVSPDDVSMIMYTGGTTGRQKGVVHTQQTLAACEVAHVIEMGLLDDERMLIISPLPHATGFLAQAGMLKGATLYIERRFDAELVLQRIVQDRITFVFMVPTMIYRVLDRADGRDLDLSALRTILYGAAPITLDRLEQGLLRFGPVFMQLYGQSESPDFLTRLRREDHRLDLPERLASCGQAVTFAEVRIVGPDDEPLPPGEVGEVVASGPYVMRGYHNLPEKTAETLRGGWLHTGDLGRMDEAGYLYLLDRKNDMIISGGMNVYSSEVENVLQRCAGVAQVAVVGIPDDDWGERVVAFVVADATGAPDLSALSAYCRQELAAHKSPKEIRLIDALPVTAYGKFDKKALRQLQPKQPLAPA